MTHHNSQCCWKIEGVLNQAAPNPSLSAKLFQQLQTTKLLLHYILCPAKPLLFDLRRRLHSQTQSKNYFDPPRVRMYFTKALIWSLLRRVPKAGIFPRPSAITPASWESDCCWTCAEWKSAACKLFPTAL